MKAIQPSSRRVRSQAHLQASHGGFSLIEAIGVMGAVGFLLTAHVENQVTSLNQAARQNERANLKTFAEAVTRLVLRTEMVPSVDQLPALLAQELSLAPAHVLTNAAGYARAFLWDPAFRLGPTAGAAPPYSQTSVGSVEPTSGRLLIVSGLINGLPSLDNTTATFNELWSNPEGATPASWNGWSGFGADLQIERINLADLFHRVVLNNLDTTNNAVYSVGESAATSIAPRHQVTIWLMEKTRIRFVFANGTEQARDVLLQDECYSYEYGAWGKSMDYANAPALSGFGLLCQQFLEAGIGDRVPKFGSTPQAVVDTFFSYLWTYGKWASGDLPEVPPFMVGGANSDQQVPSFRVLSDSEAEMEAFTFNVIN